MIGSYIPFLEIKTARLVAKSFVKPMQRALHLQYQNAWQKLVIEFSAATVKEMIGSYAEFYQPDVDPEKLKQAYRDYLIILTDREDDHWYAISDDAKNNLGYVLTKPQLQRLLEHQHPEEKEAIREAGDLDRPTNWQGDTVIANDASGLFKSAVERGRSDVIMFLYRTDIGHHEMKDKVSMVIGQGRLDLAESMIFMLYEEHNEIYNLATSTEFDDLGFRQMLGQGIMEYIHAHPQDQAGLKRIVRWATELSWNPETPPQCADEAKLRKNAVLWNRIVEYAKLAGPLRLKRGEEESEEEESEEEEY
jgi:hypothetical protein